MLDERFNVSYPDCKEAEDGFLYITYDFDRGSFKNRLEDALSSEREIIMAKITEDDIINGKICSVGSRLKFVVNKLGEYDDNGKNPYNENIRFDSSELAEKLINGTNGEEIIDSLFNMCPVDCTSVKNVEYRKIDKLIDEFNASRYVDKNSLTKIIDILKISEITNNSSAMVERAMEYIKENMTEDISIKSISEKLNCSMHHLCHKFKKNTRISITEYRNSLRLAKAKQMLANSQTSVTKIALECGYNSESYFCELFIRQEHVSPMLYRKIIQRNK